MIFLKKAFFFIVVLFLILGCSKKKASNTPEGVLLKLSSSAGDSAKKIYSEKTLSLLKKLSVKGIAEKNNINSLLYNLGEGVEYRVISKNIYRDRAVLILQYYNHPVENRIGQSEIIKFIKEDGKWLIDKSSDLQGIIGAGSSSSVNNYIKEKFSEY